MAETVDSLSIELTASTESAESSIDRLIGKLNQLKGAVAGASNFSRVANGIAAIAEAAKGLDTEAGRKLARLAGGLDALSKVGNLDNLKGAGKNLASVMKAVSGETGGKGLSGLADGIKQTNDALGSIKDSDVSRLGAIRDTLAGEVSGPLHTSSIGEESAALGGAATAPAQILPEMPSDFGDISSEIAGILDEITESSNGVSQSTFDMKRSIEETSWKLFDLSAKAKEARSSLKEVEQAMKNAPETPKDAGETSGKLPNLHDRAGALLEEMFNTNSFLNGTRDIAAGSEEAAGSVNHLHGAFAIAGERFNRFIDTISHARTAYQQFMASLREVPVLGDVVKAFDKIRSAIGGFFQSVMRIARYRLIRSMIRTITEGFSEGKKNLYEWSQAMDGHFAASMDRLATSTLYLKNSLGTLVGPLMEALEPALNWIIDALVTVINYFNMFIAAISGKSTYTAAVRAATTWGGAVGKAASNAANAAGNASNAVSDAVDEMKRTIMGFDEINKLNEIADSASGSGGSGGSGGGGGVGGGSGVGAMFEERELSGGFQQFSNALELALQDSLSRITLIVGAAELAVGAILALSGANIPLGLALIATGAVTMGSAIFANWEGIPDEIKLVVGAIEAALGGGLAVGAVLAFSTGHIGLGIGLMVAALSTEFSAVTVVWTTLKDKIGGQIQAIGVLLGGATFGMGAVLAFAGHPTIGIPMMIAGASVAAVSVNWNYLKEALQGPIGDVVALISGALLMLGVAAIAASNVPLGVGLLVAGATGLAATLAVNWNNLGSLMEGPIGKATLAISGALLVLGFAAVSAAQVPLGIGLMVAGAAGLATSLATNWDRLKEYIQGPIGTLVALISGALLVLGFTAIAASNIPLGVGLMVAGAAGLATSITPVWTTLQDKLKGPIGAVTALVSGASLVLGILAIIAGNVPLGLGLIISGAGGLASAISANWDDITTWFREMWEKFKTAAETTWDALKEIGAGIWGMIKEGVTGAVEGVGGWIKEHIFQPFVDAWHWLLGLFGGGNQANVTANASVNIASNASSVADDIAEGTTDRESIQKLKEIGATMGDAIKTGMNDRLKNISGEIWNTIVTGWNEESRELPVGIAFDTSGSIELPKSADVSVNIKKNWTGTALEALGLKDPTATVSVSLERNGWTSLADWISKSWTGNYTVKLQRLDSDWTSLANWIDSKWNGFYTVKLQKDSTWTSLADWIDSKWSGFYTVKLQKLDSDWTSLAEWISKSWAGNYTVKLQRLDSDWTSLSGWIDSKWNGFYTVKLQKDSTWTSLAGWIDSKWSGFYTVKLQRLDSDWTSLANWIDSKWSGFYTVKLQKDSTWTSLADWIDPKWNGFYTVKLQKLESDWTSLVDWISDTWEHTFTVNVEFDYGNTDGFGGATGGGGSTSGGGAGRTIKVPVEPETTVDGKTFWERLKEAVGAAGTAVDKGLDVVVRPVANKTGEVITSVVQWLFGNNNTPEMNTTVNGTAGTGFSKVSGNTFTLGGITDGSVKVNGTAGTGFSKVSGNTLTLGGITDGSVKVNGTAGTGFSKVSGNTFTLGGITGGSVTVNGTPGTGFASKLSGTNHHYTLAGIEDANANVNATLNPTNSAETVFNTDNTLGFTGTLTKKYKNQTPATVFGSGLSVLATLFRKNKKQTPATVFGSALAAFATLFKKKKGQSSASLFGTSYTAKAALKKQKKGTSSGGLFGTSYTALASLKKAVKGTSSGKLFGTALTVLASLKKANKKQSSGSLFGTAITVTATLSSTIHGLGSFVKTIVDKVKEGIKDVGKAKGGVIQNGRTWDFDTGGIINSSIARRFANVPHYAGGTTDAHGTVFVAGEAGPEILGHIGGRTEILNQSQLAQTMFAAVRSAMQGVKIAATFYNGDASSDPEMDYETMYRAMYDAFTDAMAGSNERDREKIALMREIAAKDFTPEISASSINRAQTRMNRRAGTTIVPVGT